MASSRTTEAQTDARWWLAGSYEYEEPPNAYKMSEGDTDYLTINAKYYNKIY